MTQKDKELLLRDLCARLPYGLKVLCLKDFNHNWYNLEMIDIKDNEVYVTTYESYTNRYVKIEEVRPYLFPMSSMTEEQKEEYKQFLEDVDGYAYSIDCVPQIDWLDKNYFDYRGLISMRLAIDATGLNIY